MEQVINWNPDAVFTVMSGATRIRENTNAGQNWSKTKAFQDGKVFSGPVGNHNMGMMGGDSALFPIWLANRMDPTVVTDAELRRMTDEHYKTLYNVDVTDEMFQQIYKER